ncbi:hypothetical protein B7486_29490 [cyanobacterium TDX16]|nr:hypothetical protein B7486_29490 [cyanobacterium TDX16]
MNSNQKPSMGELLRAIWHEATNFIIAKSDIYFLPPTAVKNDTYARKARFYAFLPAEEEQRDWLERACH